MNGGRTLLLGFVLLVPACGGATPPEAMDPADCVRAFIQAARVGDLDVARACLHSGRSQDEEYLQGERRWWTHVLDTYGLELTLHDTAFDSGYALVPYGLTGPAERAATYLAGLYTLVRAEDGWRVIDHELAEGSTGPSLAPFRVRLPRARMGVDHRPSPLHLAVHLAADGRLWVDGSYVADTDELRRRMLEGMSAPESAVAITTAAPQPDGLSFFSLEVRADGEVVWSKVASVLSTACSRDVLIYKVGIRVRRWAPFFTVPRVIQVELLDVRWSRWIEDRETEPPLIVVELASSGGSESAAAPTTASVAGGKPIQVSDAALREALRLRWEKMGSDPVTLGVIRVEPGAGDRIRLREVVSVIDALVSIGLADVRFEGLACIQREGPR